MGLADAGYWSEANLRACAGLDPPELLVATTKDWKQRKAAREFGCPRGRIPRHLSLRERMERKPLTKRGRALYKKRSVLVEPVFGQMKEGQGFRRFNRRRLPAVSSEATLVGTSHNLLKLLAQRASPAGLGPGSLELRGQRHLSSDPLPNPPLAVPRCHQVTNSTGQALRLHSMARDGFQSARYHP